MRTRKEIDLIFDQNPGLTEIYSVSDKLFLRTDHLNIYLERETERGMLGMQVTLWVREGHEAEYFDSSQITWVHNPLFDERTRPKVESTGKFLIIDVSQICS